MSMETKSTDPNVASIKQAIEETGKAFAEFKSANDAALKAKADGKAVAEMTEKLGKLNDRLDQLAETKARLEAIETAIKRPGGGPVGDNREVKSWDGKRTLNDAEVKHRDAVIGYLRKGKAIDSEIEQKALSVISDPDGGYLVHADLTGRIVSKVHETSPIRSLASVQTISTDALEGTTDLNEADAGWVGETAARPETNTPKVGVWRIPVHEIYAKPRATQKLLDDSAVSVETWLAKKIADKISRVSNAAFVNGDGVGKPRGFLTYPAGTADKQIEQINSGFSAGFLASGGADCLITLMESLKAEYQKRATWTMNRLVRRQVRSLKDDQKQYLWQPSMQVGVPDLLLGAPVEIFQDMPVPAADALAIVLADWSEFYQIVDRQGIRTLRDPYSAKPHVEFYSVARVGGDVLNFEAAKILKQAV